jgi:hypothetical protein
MKHCAANRKRRLSVLPNVGPYVLNVKIYGFTRKSIYIYDISRLRVNDRIPQKIRQHVEVIIPKNNVTRALSVAEF